MTKIKQFNSKMWRSGKSIGRIKGEILIELPPLIKQQAYGVLTENGILRSEHTLIGLSEGGIPKHGDKSKELSKSFKLQKNLIESLVSFFGKDKKAKVYSNSDEAALEDILIEFRDDLATESVGKFYKIADLAAAQSQLIKTGEGLFRYVNEMSDRIKKICFEVIHLLMTRLELDLEHIGFESSPIRNMESQSESPMDRKMSDNGDRKSVAIDYLGLLIKIFKIALEGITQKGLETYERIFSQYCLSYCYFRIPAFQRILTDIFEATNADSTSTKEDWRKFYFGAQEFFRVQQRSRKNSKSGTAVIISEISSHFGWQEHFFSHIESFPGYREHMNLFEELVQDEEWKQALNKRSVGFFYFISESSRLIFEIMRFHTLTKIELLDVPGYEVLLNSFIRELRVREVVAYPDALIMALVQTIEVNPRLVNAYFNIIVHKTK